MAQLPQPVLRLARCQSDELATVCAARKENQQQGPPRPTAPASATSEVAVTEVASEETAAAAAAYAQLRDARTPEEAHAALMAAAALHMEN